MANPSLDGVVVAFDIDNTLIDPTGDVYTRTVAKALCHVDLNLAPQEAFDAYEQLRSCGPALARLGLANPIHQRGHREGLAAFFLTRCANPNLQSDLQINAARQELFRRCLHDLQRLCSLLHEGTPEARLQAEWSLRQRLQTDDDTRRLGAEILRLATHTLIVEWEEVYRVCDRAEPSTAAEHVITTLKQRGAIPVVISAGRTTIQREKLRRVGLEAAFEGRVLITQAVGEIEGFAELEAAITERMDGAFTERGGGCRDEMLTMLWYFRSLIDSWRHKSSSFYARCLHAIQTDSLSPERVLHPPAFVPKEDWRVRPLRFVMVGDRYDTDVKPLIDLLGREATCTLHLRAGKYADRHPLSELPASCRPTETFTSFDTLADFVALQFDPETVGAVATPPDILPRQDVRKDYVEQGLDSPLAAVRAIANLIRDMLR